MIIVQLLYLNINYVCFYNRQMPTVFYLPVICGVFKLISHLKNIKEKKMERQKNNYERIFYCILSTLNFYTHIHTFICYCQTKYIKGKRNALIRSMVTLSGYTFTAFNITPFMNKMCWGLIIKFTLYIHLHLNVCTSTDMKISLRNKRKFFN